MCSPRVRILSAPSDESFPALFKNRIRLNRCSDQPHALSMASAALESLLLSSPTTIPFSSISLHPTLFQSSFASSNIAAITLPYAEHLVRLTCFFRTLVGVVVWTCSQTFSRVHLYIFGCASTFHSTKAMSPICFGQHVPFSIDRPNFSVPPHACSAIDQGTQQIPLCTEQIPWWNLSTLSL